MSIEAMKQALEALENKRHEYRAYQAITALRQAIEKAEKQEPVAYLDEKMKWAYSVDEMDDGEHDGFIPLYTAPPRKEWVGLTDKEGMAIANRQLSGNHPLRAVIQAIETKLKEKNNG